MSGLKKRAWLLLAASIILQIVVIRSTRALKHDFGHSVRVPHLHTLLRRSTPADNVGISAQAGQPQTDQQDTALIQDLPYSDWYDSATHATRPFILTGYLLILAFLFSFIGISASDFFCPNLATIAAYLGLNESTAGVTFLAFGNGSPDVFSTFSALKGGTFSLAIGELIGAASFIISVVVGAIALIKPFHVPRVAFLRDVWFFTIAVILVVTVLHDGRLAIYESGAMVLLYVAYVGVVIFGNWWSRRQAQKETYEALGWEEQGRRQSHSHSHSYSHSTPGAVSVPSLHLPGSPGPDSDGGSSRGSRRSSRAGSPISGSPTITPQRIRLGRRISHLSPGAGGEVSIDTPRANFSLLGAVEFRDVVNSLKKESESRGTTPDRSPMEDSRTDYFGAVNEMYSHGHRRSSSVAGHGLTGSRTHTKGRQRSVSNVGPSRSPLALSPLPPSPGRTVSSSIIQVSPSSDSNPWRDQLGHPPSATNTPDLLEPPRLSPNARPRRPTIEIPGRPSGRRRSSGPRIPSISITDPSGLPGAPLTEPPTSPPLYRESRLRLRRRTRTALRILFPSLQNFGHKSYLGMFLGITAVPAILALTLTLPVVDDGPVDEGGVALPDGLDAGPGHVHDDFARLDQYDDDADVVDGERLLQRDVGEELHHLVDNGFSPLHSPLGRINHTTLRRIASSGASEDGHSSDGEDVQEMSKELLEQIREEEALDFHKGLAAVQCVLGPMFCASVMFGDTDFVLWVVLGTGLAGLVAGAATLHFAQDGTSRPWRLVRCFAGFICSMVWIAAIADEVVSVLQAVGEILGLSDAIIGLTIFAVGNSLADLVANVTVAQFAPAMAYAACFGGPMLNLLLGVGGSGTYHMLSHPTQAPVTLQFSPTLWVSASGLVFMLVATALFVPLNGYLIDRRWACCLMVAYGIVMTINVVVEVKTGRD